MSPDPSIPCKHTVDCRVESIACVAVETFLLTLRAPSIVKAARPGQFVNLSVPRCGEILWRRPFSIHQVDNESGTFSVLFNVVGRGSQALNRVQLGDSLNCLGPLGNRFQIPPGTDELIIVAGGLGIAPFYFLLQDWAQEPFQKIIFYGVASNDRFCRLDDFSRLCSSLHLTTDDGSQGEKGTVIDSLRRHLCIKSERNRFLLTCGPTSMLRAVQRLGAEFQLSGAVSVENRMACGFGACMGCPVKLKNPGAPHKPYALACKDGPVFSLTEIVIDE
ncbi:dihydroorotate dehydrogenase electron transfer subunit [candidate division KSB1 bacterium]|nr:dihydroorotate dehydrogenase electron transfer subunit [candidate division KSB1 bacterium]